jgi:hypothetical protein
LVLGDVGAALADEGDLHAVVRVERWDGAVATDRAEPGCLQEGDDPHLSGPLLLESIQIVGERRGYVS